MKPYIVSQITASDFELFKKIESCVNELPDDINLGRDEEGKSIVLSCHILARAVGRTFNLKWIDGYFHPFFEHSWLVTPKGNLIDVYPVGILGGPFLIDASFFSSPARELYRKKRIKREFSSPSFRSAVKIVESILKHNLAKK